MSFKDRSGGGGIDNTPGFMIKMPGTMHRTQLPDWKTFTEIRIFPAPKLGPDGNPNLEAGWYPMRNSIEFDDFGPAVEVEPTCRRIGVFEQFTYLTRIPGSDIDDPTTKVCRALVDTAENSPHDLPREWCEWTRGGPGKAPKVSKVQNCIYFQAAAFSVKGKPCKNRTTGKPEPLFPVLFFGTLSLLMTFSRLGNTRVDGVELPANLPSTDDEESRKRFDELIASAFQLGDWCSPEHGRMMRIFQAEIGPNEMPHYDIEMLGEKPLSEAMQSRIRTFWTPWPKLLRYHTAEQQIGYLKRALPVEVLDFALGRSEYEGLLPEGVRGSWQRLQQRLAGAFSPGLPSSAQQQVNQFGSAPESRSLPPQHPANVQPQRQPQPQPQPQASAQADDGWGSGDGGEEEDNSPSGPALASTPAEFDTPPSVAANGSTASSTTNMQAPTGHTPADVVKSGHIDPKQLAETLNMLKGKEGTPEEF